MGSAASAEPRHSAVDEPVGFRVLSVAPGSPATRGRVLAWGPAHVPVPPELDDARAEDAGLHSLVAFFDFILSVNGVRLGSEADEAALLDEIRAKEGEPVVLEVWNAKAGRLRAVELVPRGWGGAGLLGIHTRFGTYLGLADHVLHVTDVRPRSPAELAGLVPLDDFIVGATDAFFEDAEDFANYVDMKAGQDATFYVYSCGRDSVRLVSLLVTTRSWGGGQRGLGCTVSEGVLHALPNLGTLGRNEFAGERLGTRHLVRHASPVADRSPQAASADAEAVGGPGSGAERSAPVDASSASGPGEDDVAAEARGADAEGRGALASAPAKEERTP